MEENEVEKKYKDYLLGQFKNRYEEKTLDNQQAFIYKDFAFGLIYFPDSNAFCLEYADDIHQAEQGIYPEDGDWFYPDEMSEEEMLQAMVKEIEQ